jgi:hypothetical protein
MPDSNMNVIDTAVALEAFGETVVEYKLLEEESEDARDPVRLTNSANSTLMTCFKGFSAVCQKQRLAGSLNDDELMDYLTTQNARSYNVQLGTQDAIEALQLKIDRKRNATSQPGAQVDRLHPGQQQDEEESEGEGINDMMVVQSIENEGRATGQDEEGMRDNEFEMSNCDFETKDHLGAATQDVQMQDASEKQEISNFVRVTSQLLQLVPVYDRSAATPTTMFNLIIRANSPRAPMNQIIDRVNDALDRMNPPRANITAIERISGGIYGIRAKLAVDVDGLMAVSKGWMKVIGKVEVLFPRYQVHLKGQPPLPVGRYFKAIQASFNAQNPGMKTSTMLAPENSVDTGGKCIITFSRPDDARAAVTKGLTWNFHPCSCSLTPLQFYSDAGIQMEGAAVGGGGSSSGAGNIRSNGGEGASGNNSQKRRANEIGTRAGGSAKRSRSKHH